MDNQTLINELLSKAYSDKFRQEHPEIAKKMGKIIMESQILQHISSMFPDDSSKTKDKP